MDISFSTTSFSSFLFSTSIFLSFDVTSALSVAAFLLSSGVVSLFSDWVCSALFALSMWANRSASDVNLK